jgi:hypothetical protein
MLARFYTGKVGFEGPDIPQDFLTTPNLLLGSYSSKAHPYSAENFVGFSVKGLTASPDQLAMRTMWAVVPTIEQKVSSKSNSTKEVDCTVDIMNNPGILNTRMVKRMFNIKGRGPFGETRRYANSSSHRAGIIINSKDIHGSFLRKLQFLVDTAEHEVLTGSWAFINDFNLNIPERKYDITYNPEVLETILPFYKMYISRDVISHTSPKGLLEIPIGLGSGENRPGFIYNVPGLHGMFMHYGYSDYTLDSVQSKMAALGAIYMYMHMTDNLSETGFIHGAQLIDMCLRTGLYGTDTLQDALFLMQLFSRYGISPGLYHLAAAKKDRVKALTLFIVRLWLFLYFVKALADSGCKDLGVTTEYHFQGKTPPTEEFLTSCLSRGLRPLEKPTPGLVDYYFPPQNSLSLGFGAYYLLGMKKNFVNRLSPHGSLRPSSVRSAAIIMNYDDFAMADLVTEQQDYGFITPHVNLRTLEFREAYTAPHEFDDHMMLGTISTPLTYRSAKKVALNLIDTLLIGGQPLYEWTHLMKPIYPSFKSNEVDRNEFQKLGDKATVAYYNNMRLEAKLFQDLGEAIYKGHVQDILNVIGKITPPKTPEINSWPNLDTNGAHKDIITLFSDMILNPLAAKRSMKDMRSALAAQTEKIAEQTKKAAGKVKDAAKDAIDKGGKQNAK